MTITPAQSVSHPRPDDAEPKPEAVIPSDDRAAWHRAVLVGMCAFVVSRLCVLAGAAVRASQITVDANRDGEPIPGSPLNLVTRVMTQWDGNWYLRIVRDGYPAVDPGEHHLRAAGSSAPRSSRSTRTWYAPSTSCSRVATCSPPSS